ncbi:sulfatase-like hydrolase/transferase [Pontiella sp.]|uniref:sulfatase-like hydrolase/transferase n=1 Tax=Pontiella sp. TaxID=2837462 RepID=UPI003568FF5A
MNKIVLYLGVVFLAMAVGVQAQVVTLDFTNTTDGNNAETYTYDDWDLFGDGSVTVDIVVDVVTGGTLDKIEHGWGSNGGSSGRLDAGESISFAFSDLQGSAAPYVAGFAFVGLVSSVQDGTIVWNQTAADQIDVNGVALTTYDAQQGDAIAMAYAAIAPYDLEDDFTTAGDDTAALTIDADGAFTIAQIAESGRISGFRMKVVSSVDLSTNAVEICIDFGATAPSTANWNWFTGSGNATLSNLVRLSDGAATEVGLTVGGITSDAGRNHLVGEGSTDASIYEDHIFAQNESPEDTLTFTFFGLNDALTYRLFGGFKRDHDAFEHIWTVGSDVRTNTFDGTYVDGYETFSGVSASGGEITFTISDLSAGDDWASIAELTLTANPTGNVPPMATAQHVSTLPDTPLAITLAGSDWEGGNLTYAVVSLPTRGTLATNGALPFLTYTPAAGYAGTDGFTFSVNDGLAESDPATVSITVTNELPVAAGQRVRVTPDSSVNITLSGSDPEGRDLTYRVVDSPTYGVLTGAEPNLAYTPADGYEGSDSFTFAVNDGLAESDPATVSITVASNGPNFIIFFTDDHGYNDLGCFGSPHIQTPRIDQMAAEGIRFTDGYVASPVCGPSRAGLLTGCYPIRIAEPANEKNHHSEPHGDEIMIPELLKTAGYTSALIGKWHNSGESTAATSFHAGRGPIDQGFDYFYGTPSHNGTKAVDTGSNVNTSILRADTNGTTVVDADLDQSEADYMIYNYTQEAMDFMSDAHRANEPFFLFLAHNMPHVSLGARQEFRDSAAARGLDVYTAVIEELDWSLGAVLDKLDELGIAENTFVVFSADNGPWTSASLEGYYGSAFPLKGSKMRSLEGGPRVPYIVRWPGTVPTNRVSEEIVTTMDLFPTFMDYAAVNIPEGLAIDGKSIRKLIEGKETASPHDYYYYYCYTQLSAIRDARWKLVLPRRNNPASAWMAWWRSWQDRVDEVQLYDLDNDPEETTNLAAQYPAVVKRLLEQVEVARAELGDKDRIGSGARFFDGGTLRPDIALYNNNATQPYVDEPLTGWPSSVKTGKGSALVSYDEPGNYTSVELVWAYEDQGQVGATVWAAAEGGGSASLGAVSAADAIEYEISGLNPFRQYVYRFILTDANGARWSIPAPIPPAVAEAIAYEVGIDFSDGGATPGSGSEPGWNVINGNGTSTTVQDLRTGTLLPGVSIQASGITGGEMTNDDLGFGHANYGNYLDTPFSDRSANDGVWSAGSMQIALSGLDDAQCYDVQVVAMPAASTGLTDLTIAAGADSLVRTYASFRPYINKDADPYTNSDEVLTSPFYSRPILVPALFENVATDGAGNLTITLSDDEAMPLSAIHVTAKTMRPLLEAESASTVNYWVDPVPGNQGFQLRQSTNLLVGFETMEPVHSFTSETPQPFSLPLNPTNRCGFYRVYEGTE